jgi:hypothetical protein
MSRGEVESDESDTGVRDSPDKGLDLGVGTDVSPQRDHPSWETVKSTIRGVSARCSAPR